MAAVFQRAVSAVGQSVSIDIGAAGNDRLLIVQYGDESLGTDDVAMGGTPVVDAKNFTLRLAKTNPDGIGNQQEFWTHDEASLGASNGVLTVSGGGVDASSGIRVELWYGIDSGVPTDTGFDDTTIAPTDSSITMDCPANGIVVLGYGNGNSFSSSGWTSPLIERIDAATNPPASAGLGYASGIETSAQTAKTYTATGTVTLRSTMLGMAFAEAGGTQFNQTNTGALTPSGAIVKEVLKNVAGVLAPSGALSTLLLGVEHEQSDFRFYADGTESGAAALAAQNIDINIAKEIIFGVRVGGQITGDPVALSVTLEYKKTGDPDGEFRKLL